MTDMAYMARRPYSSTLGSLAHATLSLFCNLTPNLCNTLTYSELVLGFLRPWFFPIWVFHKEIKDEFFNMCPKGERCPERVHELGSENGFSGRETRKKLGFMVPSKGDGEEGNSASWALAVEQNVPVMEASDGDNPHDTWSIVVHQTACVTASNQHT
ncbi:hypothetical protein LXL04_018089 [Taraxacum kok-saghyz]